MAATPVANRTKRREEDTELFTIWFYSFRRFKSSGNQPVDILAQSWDKLDARPEIQAPMSHRLKSFESRTGIGSFGVFLCPKPTRRRRSGTLSIALYSCAERVTM